MANEEQIDDKQFEIDVWHRGGDLLTARLRREEKKLDKLLAAYEIACWHCDAEAGTPAEESERLEKIRASASRKLSDQNAFVLALATAVANYPTTYPE